MTDEEINRRQVEHWRRTEREHGLLKWIFGSLTAFGVALAGGLIFVGSSINEIETNAAEIETLRRDTAEMRREISEAVSEVKLARFEIQSATRALRQTDDGTRK